MERVDTSPDTFLASVSDDAHDTMVELDRRITAALPGRSRVLWEGTFWGGTEQQIIGYGDIVQPRPRGSDVEWFLVGLARQKHTYSVYVNAVDDGSYVLDQYASQLGKAKVGAASISFRRLDDIDLDVLSALLARAHELTPRDQRP